jgi:hypothetical protein
MFCRSLKVPSSNRICTQILSQPHFANRIVCKIFNKDYAEIPLSNAEGFINENPINVRKIWVDSQKIIEQLSS